ncbi:MAG: sulfur carrier protein ThiS [Spirochaetes bacterium]|nr:sulfur carrier protein ThiS [Spirochaetota bacterium]
MCKITVNGKEITFYKKTVSDLIAQYKLDPMKIVVEKNGEIVHREAYNTTVIKEGDVIEIVRFVGGG